MVKTRVLIVDDQPEEIASLQKGLLNLTGAWEVAFVGSAAEAFDLLTLQPYDVVVTDFRMPGMDGTEFLNRLRKDQPRTLRFILSEKTDKDLLMACVWGTHQLLTKPCDPATLIAAIQRGLGLDAWLGNEKLKPLLARMDNLPSLPATYFEVLKQLESEHAPLERIGEAIAHDLAMTAKLLQMVNSAAIGLPRKITNTAEAVGYLGKETVRSILLCIQVFNHFEKIKLQNLSPETLWAHSVEVANAAKRLALAETGEADLADEAFTAGLLHDLGKLILASNLGEQYDAVLEAARQSGAPLWQVEEQSLGASHAEIGTYQLGLWGMPVSLLEATGFHHRPAHLQGGRFTVLTAVHVANALAHERSGEVAAEGAPLLDLPYLERLGLADRLETWRRIVATKPGEPLPEQVVASPPAVVPAPQEHTPAEAEARAERPGVRPRGGLPVWLGRIAWKRRLENMAPVPATTPLRAWLQRLALPVGLSFVLTFAVWFTLSRMDQGTDSATIPRNQGTAAARTETRKGPDAEASVVPPNVPPEREALPPTPLTAEPVLAVQEVPAPSAPVRETLQIIPPEPRAPSSRAHASFPSLRLQAVFYRQSKPLAKINGRTLSAGDDIDGVTIVAISRDQVTLAYAGQTRMLSLR